MEINKQLFEDVLSGKLKGTFVLRNGSKLNSSTLSIYTRKPYSISLDGHWYTSQGEFCLAIKNHRLDIVDFISDTIEIDLKIYSYNEEDIQFGHHMKIKKK